MVIGLVAWPYSIRKDHVLYSWSLICSHVGIQFVRFLQLNWKMPATSCSQHNQNRRRGVIIKARRGECLQLARARPCRQKIINYWVLEYCTVLYTHVR